MTATPSLLILVFSLINMNKAFIPITNTNEKIIVSTDEIGKGSVPEEFIKFTGTWIIKISDTPTKITQSQI